LQTDRFFLVSGESSPEGNGQFYRILKQSVGPEAVFSKHADDDDNVYWGHSRGNAWKRRSHCWKAVATHVNAVPVVKVFKIALWTALQAIFRPKCVRLQGFANTISIFYGDHTPDSCRSAPGAWTQTPISAWLASVPIVPVSRNDHWCRMYRPIQCKCLCRVLQRLQMTICSLKHDCSHCNGTKRICSAPRDIAVNIEHAVSGVNVKHCHCIGVKTPFKPQTDKKTNGERETRNLIRWC